MCQLHRGRSIFDKRTSHTIGIHHTEISAACSSAAYSSTAKTIGLSNTQARTIQASATTTNVPSSSTSSTVSSLVCPAANKANYTATNKPPSSIAAFYAIPDTSLTYQVLCNTNFKARDGATAVIDSQIVYNVTSFKDCLDACALYIFQTPAATLPSLGRTGLVWDPNDLECYLKNNITLSKADSENSLYAAVLISK